MGNNISGDSEKGFACGPYQGRRVERKTTEEDAYLAGRNLGYHLGFNHGYESGFEKGYAEGSTFGYNNGFLTALRLGEGGDSPVSANISKTKVFQTLQELITGGMLRIFLAGHAAVEAEELFRTLDLETIVLNRK